METMCHSRNNFRGKKKTLPHKNKLKLMKIINIIIFFNFCDLKCSPAIPPLHLTPFNLSTTGTRVTDSRLVMLRVLKNFPGSDCEPLCLWQGNQGHSNQPSWSYCRAPITHRGSFSCIPCSMNDVTIHPHGHPTRSLEPCSPQPTSYQPWSPIEGTDLWNLTWTSIISPDIALIQGSLTCHPDYCNTF